MKGCTSSVVRTRPQAPAMRLHNGTADGQPHTATLRLGGKERRKNLIHLLRWQSHARVTDRELELTVLQLRLHRKLSAGVLHGFDGVEHEVHEHLLQLDTIGHDFGQVGRKFCAHGDRVPIGLASQQSQHLAVPSVPSYDSFPNMEEVTLGTSYLLPNAAKPEKEGLASC